MHPLYSQIKNPLTEQQNTLDRERLLSLFPTLSKCPDQHFLSLRCYSEKYPEKLFDRTSYNFLLEWLSEADSTDQKQLQSYLNKCQSDIDIAFKFLRETNSENYHDDFYREGDDYDVIRFIDKHIHPTYLRLVEAVLTPLASVVAFFSRISRGAGTEGLGIWSIVEELSDGSSAHIIGPYRHIIRNGIAHGGITFHLDKISYQDNKGNVESFQTTEVVHLHDELLDTCNGLAAALKVFLLVTRQKGYTPPHEFLLEELQEETKTPWWQIEGCLQSVIDKKRQLLIYARPNSRAFDKVFWSTLQTGILAEFFAPGYDRYFISLRTPKALPGWGAFDGRKLKELRASRSTDLSEYAKATEENTIFYAPKYAVPKFLSSINTLLYSFKLIWPVTATRLRQKRGIPDITCRNAKTHRNSWGCVLTGQIVINDLSNEETIETVRKWKKRIIKTAIKHARKTSDRLNYSTQLPLGYVRLSIFRKDYRRRRLAGFGLGEDLVCTLQFQRLQRIKTPDIWGSTIEASGKWRIAWNSAWLKETGLAESIKS
ncbi:MAG: hypothetical protein KAT62_05595 [Desulfuromonadales bacterium]|nr:hypothetical protein [Desulfuromonadales bacterium]